MAGILPSAVASARQIYQGQPGTTAASVYTAPANTNNVPAPYATAYITEYVLANTTGAAAAVSLFVGGSAAQNAIVPGISIAPNDAKIVTGIRTAIPAGASIYASAGTASAITVTITGVEVQ